MEDTFKLKNYFKLKIKKEHHRTCGTRVVFLKILLCGYIILMCTFDTFFPKYQHTLNPAIYSISNLKF